MTGIGLRLGQLLSFGLLVGSITAAMAAPAKTDDEDVGMVNSLHADMSHAFTLSKELKLDPALRTAAIDLRDAHLARIKEQLPAWFKEERRVQTSGTRAANSNDVYNAVMARLTNELALWHIEPGDADYERSMFEVIKARPTVCELNGAAVYEDFAIRMLRVQAMPAARQQAALATERQLLARWGKPRAPVQPWPSPLPEEAAMLAVAKIRSGGPRPPLALAPLLASNLLAENMKYEDLPWESKCMVQQWWLRVSLALGAKPEAALTAFRYGTLHTATERFGHAFKPSSEDPAEVPGAKPRYPKLATRYIVTGTTTVTRQFDAAGKPISASVTERKITVPGIRGTRPVAFEDVFDALTLRYALDRGDAEKPGTPRSAEFALVWNLEDAAPPAKKPAAKSAGAKP